MTIKRRLFLSNIRMIVISFVAAGFTGRIAAFFLLRTAGPNQETISRIRDILSQEPHYDMQMVLWFLAFALFIILISVINGFSTYTMTKRIVKPLEPLNEGVRQIHDNNLAYRIDYKGDDEFRPVCEAFNEMAARLETSAAERQKDETNRKELIAGISHDLRTPLTSIKGYLEGIEKGVASTPEMRENYFSIIRKKTDDLEHIIEQLFLFSKLDMNEFPINLRRTDIAPAVSDMIEDSIPEYAARGLDINLSEMPKGIFASADVLLLRNVVINILENSVKYKEKEQGQIEISAATVNSVCL